MGMNSRVAEVKARVDGLKASVAQMQANVAEARDRARGRVPRSQALWDTYNARKKDLLAVQQKLREAKAELVRLSGTTGGDPKWDLLREAWHVLSGLDEAGIDIGERGHALVDEIEFHVPLAKLHEDIVKPRP